MKKEDDIKRFIGVDELAELLGVKPSWIYAQTSSGAIPHLKVGHYVRFSVDEVLAWLKCGS